MTLAALGFLRLGQPVMAAPPPPPPLPPPADRGAGRPTPPPPPSPASDNATRAAATYATMQQYFYVAAQKLYHEHSPAAASDQTYPFLWSFEEASKAKISLYGMPNGSPYAADVQARLDGRETYWDGGMRVRGYRSYPRTGDRYFDDDAWVGSDLVQHDLLTGSAVALNRAQGVFSYLQTGWQNNLPNPGGVRWVDASFNGDRGTDSTGGFAKLGAHLYDATGRKTRSDLDWAQQAYDWLKQYLVAPNGLYWDSMRADGTLNHNQWIYNQGILIGANVLLNRVTGTASYLTEARRLADTALAFFSNNFADPYYSAAGAGIGAYSGRGIFNAIFFRNLLLLHAVTPTYVPPSGSSYLQRMQTYADTAWGDPAIRDPTTGLFTLDGGAQHSLLDQAGMVQIYALLAWAASSYGKLA